MNTYISKLYQQILDNYAPLTHEEELTASNDELVLHNFRYMFRAYSRFLEKIDTDEYVSEIFAGMYDAVKRWDKSRGLKFFTFAKSYVNLYLINYCRAKSEILSYPPSQLNRINSFKKFLYDFSVKNNRQPTAEEAKKSINFNKKLFDKYMRYNNFIIRSINAPDCGDIISGSKTYTSSDNKENFTLESVISDDDVVDKEEFSTNNAYEKKEIYTILNEYINNATSEVKTILLGLYYQNKSYTEISKELGMPCCRVKAIHNDALSKLHKVVC